MEENIRETYARINEVAKQGIERKKIDIQEVLETYASSTSEDKIKVLYRLNDDELSYILRNYVTPEIAQRRQVITGALNNVKFTENSRKARQADGKKLTLQEAIDLVEGR